MLNVKKKYIFFTCSRNYLFISANEIKLKEYGLFGLFSLFLSCYFLPRGTIYASRLSKLLVSLQRLCSVDQLSVIQVLSV